MKIVAAIPSYSADALVRARPWINRLQDHGVEVIIAANSAEVALTPLPTARVLDMGLNRGFAAAVNAVLKSVKVWDWALILNVDITMGDETVPLLTAILAERQQKHHPELIFLDAGALRPIPGRLQVFLTLSLWSDVRRRLLPNSVIGSSRVTNSQPAPADLPAGTYGSFSAVAVNSCTWQTLGGLDEAFPFCFEDADFAIRFGLCANTPPTAVSVGITHAHSATSKALIDDVLPVVCYSALVYLSRSERFRPFPRILVVLALIARVGMVAFSSANRSTHLRGIWRGLDVCVRRRRPRLPLYGLTQASHIPAG